jgi:hypothetical protein
MGNGLILAAIMTMNKIVTIIGAACLYYLAKLAWENRKPAHKPSKRGIFISFTHDFITFKSKSMAVSMYPGQTAVGTLQPVDRKGNPSNVEPGSVKFSSSDESVFTVAVNPDNELQVTVTAVAPGVAQLNYEADADLDLGDGETKTINGFAAVEVLPEEAVGFGFTFDEPVDPAA